MKVVTDFHLATGKRYHQAECKVCYRLRAKENMRRLSGYYTRHPGETPLTPVQAKPFEGLGRKAVDDIMLLAVRSRHKEKLDALANIHTGVVEGFVYVVSNPAWEGWVKIGCAVDPMDRTASYQTGSPHRDYKLEGYAYTPDRRMTEKAVHVALDRHRHGGEWFFCPIQEAVTLVKKFCLQHSTGGSNP